MMRNMIRKYPNIAYLIMALGWTWILVFGLILFGDVDVNKPTPVFVLTGLVCGISPSVAAILVTGAIRGKDGVRALLGKFAIKSSFRGYALAITIVPVATLLTIIISNFTLRKYEFGLVVPMILMGFIWPFFSSFGEEFGWRGYILPQLLNRFSPLKSGILLGILWEVWHLPMHYLGYMNYGTFMIPAFLVVSISMILNSVIMTHLYIKSQGNLKLMVLYHATITGSAIVFSGFVQAEALPKYTVYEGLITACMLLAVAAILYTRGGSSFEQRLGNRQGPLEIEK